jgi:uncharacterized damage-inducible protein DinB
MDDLRYPVGRFDYQPPTPAVRGEALAQLERLPAELRAAVRGLTESQLDTPYRPDGWTVRQVVHHVADSHMNGFIRVKLALTEVDPLIRPYDQDGFARLADTRLPVEVSLALVEALHTRWTALWRSVPEAGMATPFRHPELGAMTLDRQLQLYAWHGRHHTAHILGLRRREGW